MDWNYWLGRKYDLLGQNAAADTTRAQAGLISANAGANFDAVRAGLLPAESKSNIGLQAAQAGLAAANARNTDETTKYIAPLARSSIGLNSAQSKNLGAEAAFTGSRATSVDQVNRLGINIGDILRLGFLGN
jgi:hypothetical protein